ncbi:MAG: radical SAM protein [Clostridia bacterium]|nr:radical SAM protein [Clostridia bacterium]
MAQGCALCPRKCGADREKAAGFCGAGALPRVAKVMLHPWEEPCICGGKGAGAVFFSGCALRCVFCQNHEISQSIKGKAMTKDDLAKLFLRLEEEGASCLDLVSLTPYLETLIPALEEAKKEGLTLRVVYNTSGYENVESLARLTGLVDVYLPDMKYKDPALSLRYSVAADYFDFALPALKEMRRQTGKPLFDGEKLLRGVIVRHLVLPGLWRDTRAVLQALFDAFGADGIVLSLMRQYTPCHRTKEFPEIDRLLTTLEYDKAVRFAEELGFCTVYTQAKESANTDYIPEFTENSQLDT